MRKRKNLMAWTATISLVALLITTDVNAQLFSSGNNTISGNNVGIALSSPTALFHIHQITNRTTGDPLMQNVFQVQSYNASNPGFNIIGYNEDGTPIYEPLGPENLEDTKPYFLINRYGFVGIDIEMPEYKFHLNGTGFVNNNFYINGKLGIGTTSPSENLQVVGNVIVDGNETVNGNTITNGNETINNGNLTINNGYLLITGNVNGASTGSNEIKLKNDGYIRAREIQVDLQAIPDYVFKEDYNLMPLKELKTFVETNKHLPNIKSEAEFKEEGTISLTEMNLKLLEKVEELTLYILQLEERLSTVELGGGVK